jgi:hypothetical protein
MKFFQRPKRLTLMPSTGHAGDDQLLHMIAAEQGGLTATREWLHYLYCSTATGAGVLESAAEAAGWDVRRVSQGEGIIASRSDLPVNQSTVVDARKFFENSASKVEGGEYDGWEAAV